MTELIAHILSHPPEGVFVRVRYYWGGRGPVKMFDFRNDPDYAKRINSRVTVCLSEDTDELVGCQIKGVGRVLHELGDWTSRSSIRESVEDLALGGDGAKPDPETRKIYREVYKKAERPTWMLNFSVQTDGPGPFGPSLRPLSPSRRARQTSRRWSQRIVVVASVDRQHPVRSRNPHA